MKKQRGNPPLLFQLSKQRMSENLALRVKLKVRYSEGRGF